MNVLSNWDMAGKSLSDSTNGVGLVSKKLGGSLDCVWELGEARNSSGMFFNNFLITVVSPADCLNFFISRSITHLGVLRPDFKEISFDRSLLLTSFHMAVSSLVKTCDITRKISDIFSASDLTSTISFG